MSVLAGGNTCLSVCDRQHPSPWLGALHHIGLKTEPGVLAVEQHASRGGAFPQVTQGGCALFM